MEPPLDLATIRHLEELAAAAWPPAAAPDMDGWRLRHNAGVSRRANSVQALEHRGEVLAAQIQSVEAAYRGWGLLPRFQLCPASQPPELDACLERLGYVPEARTAVQVATAADVCSAAWQGKQGHVEVLTGADERWWSVYAPSDGGGATETAARRAILGRVQDQSGYALLSRNGVPAAVGLAVARGEWAGVFCVATVPEQRRTGAATAVMAALASWATDQGASRLYLQVMESNLAALALYARLGFRTAYHYHYRTAPHEADTCTS